MNLIITLLGGTIILIIVACVVIFFVRLAKNHKKKKIDRLTKETADKKREEDQAEQQRLGLKLTRVLTEEVSKRTDQKYGIGYFPKNDSGKLFSIVLFHLKVPHFQVDINVSENNIHFLDTDFSIQNYTLGQLNTVEKMLCEKIRALR